ncbi:MAG: hypothetical protein Q9167_007051 [Letrouitia subvulpina]
MEGWQPATIAEKRKTRGKEYLLYAPSGPRASKMKRGYKCKPACGPQSMKPREAEPAIVKTSKRKGIFITNDLLACQGKRSNRSLNRGQLPNKDQKEGSISQHIVKDEISEFTSEVSEFEIESESGYGSLACQQVVYDPLGDADPLSIDFRLFNSSPSPAYAQAQISPLNVINTGDEDLGKALRRPLSCATSASHQRKAERLLQKSEELLAMNSNSYGCINSRIVAAETSHSANRQTITKTEGAMTRWQKRLDAMSQWNHVFEKNESDPDDENALIPAMDIVVPKLQKATREAHIAKEEHDQSMLKLEKLRQELQKVEEGRPILEAEVQEMRAYNEALKKLMS